MKHFILKQRGRMAMLFFSLLLALIVEYFMDKKMTLLADENKANLRHALFAGGCFWCMEPPYQALKGVTQVISGYTGGKAAPTYEEVSSGITGHYEAIQVFYDPQQVSYECLLDVFWQQVDPTDAAGQFVDRGTQYRTAIFYETAAEKQMAEQSKQALAASGRFDRPIVTPILPSMPFYPAEDYHQDYHQKNPLRYKFYRSRSGRDAFLQTVWQKIPPSETCAPRNRAKPFQKPSEAELQQRLSPLQYEVTQKAGTERPFENEFWNNKKAGIYVDIVSGEPLFSSSDKFDSGTGWPSFTKPLVSENIVEKKDRSLLFMTRIEVRSKQADSHLGHVFHDGPTPLGLRYCINSAALRFIPEEELEKAGYGEYLK